ncbi:unnamed protein product [Musa acuminata subsp. burmannicoides]
MGFGVGVGEAIVWVGRRRGAQITRGWSFFDDSMPKPSTPIDLLHRWSLRSSSCVKSAGRVPFYHLAWPWSRRSSSDVVEAQAQRGGGGEANVAADALYHGASAYIFLCFHQISDKDMKQLNY